MRTEIDYKLLVFSIYSSKSRTHEFLFRVKYKFFMLARKTGHNCQKIQTTLVIIYIRSYPFGYKREDFSCSIENCGRVPHHFGFCNLKIHVFITTEEKTLVVSWYNLPASFCMKVLFTMSYGNISDRIL